MFLNNLSNTCIPITKPILLTIEASSKQIKVQTMYAVEELLLIIAVIYLYS